MRKILFLSQLFATDRMLLHSGLLRHLEQHSIPEIWSHAPTEPHFPIDHPNSKYFQPFFHKRALPEWVTQLRHFNDYAWDQTGLSFSRQSIWKHTKKYALSPAERSIRQLAWAFSRVGMQSKIEGFTRYLAKHYGKRREITHALQESIPAMIIAMTPFWPYEMSVIASAQDLSIPTAAFITSWDNITTKTRLLFDYDLYLVWSEAMRDELLRFYPLARSKPVFVVGPPQYDVFFDASFRQSREEFCDLYDFDPALKIVVYCLGSPNFIREDFGAFQFIEKITQDLELSNTQIIVRTHPAFADRGYTELGRIQSQFPDVVIQASNRHWKGFAVQNDDSTREWINTIRHADVVVNLSSTIAVDAAIFDRPIVNLNFDPEPGCPNNALIKEINVSWNHFNRIAASGGVWLVNSIDEAITAAKQYLITPNLHSAERRWIVSHVCGYLDGQAGVRMAEAIATYLKDKNLPTL